MDDLLKEQLILRDYLGKKGYDLDDDKFNQFYSIYQSKKTGTTGDVLNRAKAGAKSSIASGQLLTGDYEGATENIKEANQLRLEDPELQTRINQIMESESIPDTLVNLVKDPKAAFSLLAESLPTSVAAGLTALPVGRAGQAVVRGGPAAARTIGATTFGGVTGAAEYGSTILQTMAESGVDITNPKEIEAVITHPEIGPKLKQKGLERGVPIAMFDAVSYGIAGKLAQLGKGGLAGEAVAQAGLGGAGEASAQLISEGEITDPAAIGLEIGLEAATGAPQAIIQPTLENVLQGTQGASSGQIEALGTNPEDILAEITEIDTENAPKSDSEAPTQAPKDTELESKVRQAQRIEFPQEIARGTPKQMTNRLMSLNKADLQSRAIDNAGIDSKDIEGLTKKEITDAILEKFNIDQAKDEVQTPSQKPIENLSQKPIPEELKGINEPTRKKLLQVAKQKPNNKNLSFSELIKQKNQQEAAENWLSQLEDNVALNKALTSLSRNKGGLNFKGSTLEQANQALKKIKSKQTKDETKVKATADLIENLKRSGYFANDELAALNGKNKELNKFIQAKYDTGSEEGTKDLLEGFMSNPRTRNAIIGDIFEDFRKGENPKVDTPTINRLGRKYSRFVNRDINIPVQRLDRDVDQTPEREVQNNIKAAEEISEYEAVKAIKVMRDNAEVPETVWKPENFNLDRDSYKKSGVNSTLKEVLRSFDFMKTMGAKARSEPIFGPFFHLYRAKDAFREQLFRQHLNDFILLKEQHGIKRLEGASAVLEQMTGPWNSVEQIIETDDSGRVRFKDKDGVRKVVDLATSQAIQDLQKLFKQQMLIEMQTFKTRAAKTYGLSEEAQRTEMLDKIDELRALGDDTGASKLENLVDIFDKMERMYRSNKAYFPHTRNRGPYAIATYTQDEDGKIELAGLYSVKSDKFGNLDTSDFADVQARIQQDQEKHNVTFVTSKGENISGATPFLMTYEDMRKNIMRDAKNPNIAYEALANLLTNKNIDPKVLNETFDKLSFDSETERFFMNYRDKKNYYGYDIDDPISSMLDSLNARSAMLTRFQYSQPLNKLYAEATQDLQKLGKGGKKSLSQLTDYYEYMNSPADDAAKIRELTFWYFLAGNPSTSLLQLMSTYMNTLPWLSQYQGPVDFIKSNLKSFTTSLNKATRIQANKSLLNSRTVPQFAKKVNISQGDARILLKLYERGILDPGYAIDAVNYSRNQEKQKQILRGEKGRFGTVGVVGGKLKDIGQGMIQVTEDVARMNSALLVLDSVKNPKQFEKIGSLLYSTDALFRELVKSKYEGRITKEAIVEHAIDENHAIFGKNPRPSALRSKTGAGLFAFLQYPISILEQMIRLLTTRGVAGKKAAVNMILTYPILFGGMTAVPAYETWDWMTKWLQRLMNDGRGPTNLDIVLADAMEFVGIKDPKMKDLIMKGPILSGGADIDASQRIAVQFPLQPFMDVFASPDSNGMTSQSQALQFLGPLATIPTGAMNMLNRIEGGEGAGSAFVDSLAPVWLRNLKKANDIRTGELRNTRGKRMIEGPDENPELYKDGLDGPADEVFKQAMGLRPAVVSEASRAHYYQGLEQSATISGYSKKYAKVAKALVAKRNGEEGAKADFARAMLELYRYNANQEEPKTRKELMRALKTSLRARVEAEEKPLKQRRHISKKTKFSEAPQKYGLPRLEGQLEDKGK
jgi:hypothetical protein